MKTYKAPDNSLHAIEPEFAHMLPAGCVEITEAEAVAIRAHTPEQLAAIAAAQALQAQREADEQDARDDALVQAVAAMTPAQLVTHIDATFPTMDVAQRRVLKVLAKMARISANRL